MVVVVVVRAAATLFTPLDVEAALVKIGDFGELSVGEAAGDGVFRRSETLVFLPLFVIFFFFQKFKLSYWKLDLAVKIVGIYLCDGDFFFGIFFLV